MILRPVSLAIAATLLASQVLALSAADIPADTPISKLIASANANRAAGNTQDALVYLDVALTRDPQNYITFFQRGATYLSLGKETQATKDFDKVLSLKPNHEGALVQRAKIRARHADWVAARKDYEAAGKQEEIQELADAQGASVVAFEAAGKRDWETCVAQAGVAIMVAGAALDIRKLRAKCRFERGEVMEGMSDLQHVLRISPRSTEPHLQISAMSFYSLGETDKGITQMSKCLRSDPDSKACSKLRKREKQLNKRYEKIRQLLESRQYIGASKELVGKGEDTGLIDEVEEDTKQYKAEGIVHVKAQDGLYGRLAEMACEAFVESSNHKRAATYCAEAMTYNPTSLHGLLHKAQKELDTDDFEEAVRTLNEAKEHHQESRKVQEMLQKAHQLLKRSKTKDYYKVLGVDREADERQIKKAYRQLSKQFHPDKASAQGITKEDAEKKMASINEAYEVLSDPELKARFDNGDDPNSQEGQQGNPFQGSPFGGQQFVFRQGGFPGGQFKFQGGGGFPFP